MTMHTKYQKWISFPCMYVTHWFVWIFSYFRFPDGGALFLLLFYIPCGLLLVTFRFFLGLQLLLMMSILPKESLVKRYKGNTKQTNLQKVFFVRKLVQCVVKVKCTTLVSNRLIRVKLPPYKDIQSWCFKHLSPLLVGGQCLKHQLLIPLIGQG